MHVPLKRKVNIKTLAWQAYETLAAIAAVLPQNQNAFGAAKNCCFRCSSQIIFGVIRPMVNHLICRCFVRFLKLGFLPSTGITRFRQYYEPLRHPLATERLHVR